MQAVRDEKIDLVVITDPYKPLRTNQWASDAIGKAAIWSCGELLFQDKIDSTKKGFVRAKLGNVHFYSCYALPSLKMEEFTDLIDRLVEGARERSLVVIAGDFSAWATDWGSKWTNRRGNELMDAMTCLDVVVLNTGDVRTYEREGRTSIVDLTIASSSLVRQNNKWKMNDVLNLSDHRVIYWEVATGNSIKIRPHKKTNAGGWEVSMFDPELFRTALATGPMNANNAIEEAEEVMERIVDACDAAMPRKNTCNRHPPVYW